MTAQGQDRYLAKAFEHLPLQEIDEVITGQPIDFFRHWLEHSTSADPYWQPIDFRRTFANVTAPMHLVTGWYDLFTRYQLEDYRLLKAAGHQPYLTVDATHHTSLENYALTVQEGLAWFDAYLKNDPSHLRQHPVRIFVMGSQQWREMDDWPPPAQDTHFFLHDRQREAPHLADCDAIRKETWIFEADGFACFDGAVLKQTDFTGTIRGE